MKENEETMSIKRQKRLNIDRFLKTATEASIIALASIGSGYVVGGLILWAKQKIKK